MHGLGCNLFILIILILWLSPLLLVALALYDCELPMHAEAIKGILKVDLLATTWFNSLHNSAFFTLFKRHFRLLLFPFLLFLDPSVYLIHHISFFFLL